MDITINYKPYDYQLLFHKDSNRWKIICGGRRAGKSLSATMEAIRCALSTPDQLIVWIAPSYAMSRDIGFNCFLQYYDVLQPAIQTINYGEMSVKFSNGSCIMWRSGDNPDMLRGKKYNLVVIDEAAFCKKDVWFIIRPGLADSKGSAILLSTPNGLGNWYHDVWLDEGWSKYLWPSTLNPLMTVDEIESIKRQISEKEYRQEILAEFITFAGLVYEDFNDSNIIEASAFKYNKGYDVYLGMDFGFANATAVCFMAIDRGTQNRVIQFDEIYVERMQIDDIMKKVYTILEYWKIGKNDVKACYCDPAGEAHELTSGVSPVDIMRSNPYHMNVINKATKINPGIAMVRAWIKNTIGERRYYVSRECKETIRSLNGYQYTESRDGQVKEEALKDGKHDHMCDAIRYFFVNKFDTIKYVADIPRQEDYARAASNGFKVLKNCNTCHKPFISSTSKSLPPFVCNNCKEI